MTIYFCGGEDIDFFGDLTVRSVYDSTFSRCSVAPTNSNTTIKSKSFGFTFVSMEAMAYLGRTYGTNTYMVLGFGNFSVDNSAIGVGLSSDIISISKIVSGTLSHLASESTASFTSNGYIRVSIQNYGTSGTVKAYWNDVLLVEYTGDITVSGVSTLDCVHFGGSANASGRGEGSQIIVGDESLAGCRLKTLAPNAAGDTNNFDGTYASIDEVSKNGSDYIFSETIDDKFQCNLTDCPSGYSQLIVSAVRMSVCSATSESGPDLQIGIKTNSTESLGSDLGLSTDLNFYDNIFQINPITSTNFTQSEINSLQFACKIV